MIRWNQLGFQDFVSPLGALVGQFHDGLLLIVSGIFVLVVVSMARLCSPVSRARFLGDNNTLEVVWTLLPALVLVGLGYPRLVLLYSLDAAERVSPSEVVKVTGHQWYWGYQQGNVTSQGALDDEVYSATSRAKKEGLTLLDCANELLLPSSSWTKVHVTSRDVLHRWTVPALTVKLDAIPGRLNSARIFRDLPGKFYGQCSELCGAGHSYMPTVVLFF